MERATVRQMLADPTLIPKIARHARAEGFAQKPAQTIARIALRVFKTAGEVPTRTQIVQELQDEVAGGKLVVGHAEAAEAWLRASDAPTVPSSYVVEKVLGRERQRALMMAVEQAGELHLKGEYDAILPAIQRADTVGRLTSGKGVDLRASLDARTRARIKHKAPERFGTGVAEIDDVMDGGLSLDNPLGLFIGGLKSGKSLALDAIALHLASVGQHVAQFTLENGENEVLLRHDAAVSGIPMSQVYSRADEVHERVSDWFSLHQGSIWVRKMPSSASVKDTEIELDAKRHEDGWTPTVILWDYTKLFSANDPKRWDGRPQELGAITLEMRECLERRRCVGWSAAQVKNSALEKETPSAADIGYSTEMMENVDIGIAICRTLEERNDDLVRFFVAASRFSADGRQTIPLASAYTCGRICARIHGLPPLPPK